VARRISLVATAIFAALASVSAYAAEVTVAYDGIVTRVDGAQPNAVAVGQPIHISYVLDTSVADASPADPVAGIYFSAMKKITVSMPDAGFEIIGENGTVQTFNDEPNGPSDQVFIYTYNHGVTTTDTFGGLAVNDVNLDFVDSAAPGGTPLMLSSDAIPTEPLVTEDSFLMLYTSAGYTFVYFLADTTPTVAELVEDGVLQVQALVAAGKVKSGIGKALSSKLNDVLVAHAAGNDIAACIALAGFRNQVANLPRGQISAATTAELAAIAEALRIALGGC
jgi:hypothetical protein